MAEKDIETAVARVKEAFGTRSTSKRPKRETRVPRAQRPFNAAVTRVAVFAADHAGSASTPE